MENADCPVWPCPDLIQYDVSLGEMMGLTKREWFAGMAMKGILANPVITDADQSHKVLTHIKLVKYFAYAQADAMLKEGE